MDVGDGKLFLLKDAQILVFHQAKSELNKLCDSLGISCRILTLNEKKLFQRTLKTVISKRLLVITEPDLKKLCIHYDATFKEEQEQDGIVQNVTIPSAQLRNDHHPQTHPCVLAAQLKGEDENVNVEGVNSKKRRIDTEKVHPCESTPKSTGHEKCEYFVSIHYRGNHLMNLSSNKNTDCHKLYKFRIDFIIKYHNYYAIIYITYV